MCGYVLVVPQRDKNVNTIGDHRTTRVVRKLGCSLVESADALTFPAGVRRSHNHIIGYARVIWFFFYIGYLYPETRIGKRCRTHEQ